MFQYGLCVSVRYVCFSTVCVFQYGLCVSVWSVCFSMVCVFQYGLCVSVRSVCFSTVCVFQYGLCVSVRSVGFSMVCVFQYGLAGHFWCAAGAAIQLFLFAIVGCEIRIKAPGAKTFLQVIRARHGAITHLIVMVFALFANAVISSMVMAEGTTMLTSVTDGTYRYLSVLPHCGILSNRGLLM